jgi:hypothetical protein
MNNELESIRKDAIVAQMRYYPNICLKGISKTMNKLSVLHFADETATYT